MRRHADLGVDWHVKGRRRRIATTTVATSNLINYLAEIYPQDSVTDTIERINFDDDAKAVLRLYVERGYGAVRTVDLLATNYAEVKQ